MKVLYMVFLLFSMLKAQDIYGVCQLETMDTNSAKEYIEKILDKEPQNVTCTIQLANLYLKKGELSRGFELAVRAHKINPEQVKKSILAPILDFALKMTDLKIRALEVNDKELWNEIGDGYYEMGVYKEALIAYQKSIDINQKQSDIGLKLALSYQKTGQTFKALEELKNLIFQDADNFYANYYLAKLLKYGIKDTINSKKYFQKARELLEANTNTVLEKEYPKFLSDIIYELST
jgi:tetratricopeptide (TPR) repeat protein